MKIASLYPLENCERETEEAEHSIWDRRDGNENCNQVHGEPICKLIFNQNEMQKQVSRKDKLLSIRPVEPKGYTNFDDGIYEKKFQLYDPRSPEHVDMISCRSIGFPLLEANTTRLLIPQSFISSHPQNTIVLGIQLHQRVKLHNQSLPCQPEVRVRKLSPSN